MGTRIADGGGFERGKERISSTTGGVGGHSIYATAQWREKGKTAVGFGECRKEEGGHKSKMTAEERKGKSERIEVIAARKEI